jgi:hypothetical protein
MSRRNQISLITLAVSVACAPPPSTTGSAAAPQRQVIFQGEQGVMMTDAVRAEAVDIDAPPTAVWAAVKKVYADLEIPVTIENPTSHQIGNANFVKSRQMGGERMTQLVNCGSGITGPNAATYRITMSLMTDVSGNPNGTTKLQTTFISKGQDVTAGSSDQIPCGSTGRVELMLLDRVKAALGKS